MNSRTLARRLFRPAYVAAAASAVWLAACNDSNTTPSATAEIVGPTVMNAATSVNLDQWANLPGKGWQNGNLNGNNSAYAEGRVIPFRLAIEGLDPGTHTININYDFTAGGRKAYDFLASVEATETDMLSHLCDIGGGGVSSMCAGGLPTPDEEDFPIEVLTVDGKTVAGAIAAAAVQRKLRLYGGTIISIGTPTHDGPFTGNSTGNIVVTFSTTGSAALLVWGGHLGVSAYWNSPEDPDGAGQISGAPWHMRTLNLDGGGAANQDRSIQPSALVEPAAQINVVKTAVASPVNAGSPIAFDITVTNTGGTSGTVTLTDNLPTTAGLSWTIAGGYPTTVPTVNGLSCAINAGVLTCSASSMTANSSFTVRITSPTTPASCTTIANTAVATHGGIPVDDAAEVVVQCPNVSIVKTPNSQNVLAGNAITFTVVVSNAGPGSATGVALNDPLPAGSGVTWAIAGGSPTASGMSVPTCQVTGSVGSQVLTCNSTTIPSGASYTVAVTSATTTPSCGVYNNTATYTSTNAGTGNDGGQITVQCPNLTVTKTPDGQTVDAGTAISFDIVVQNTGDGAANGVTLSDVLPVGTGISWSIAASYPSATGMTAPTCQIGGTPLTLTCNSTTVPAGASYTVRITTATAYASCATYNNTANVSSTNAGSPSDNGSITVRCANLSVVKTPDNQTVNSGSPIGFAVVVSNAGPGTAMGVTLNDPLPGGGGVSPATWALDGAVQTSGGLSAPTCSVTGAAGSQVLACTAVNMASGTSYTVTVTAQTTVQNCGAYNNTATASASNHPNRSDVGSIDVDCPPGCTRTIGYWKTHAGFGPQADVVSAKLPIWLGTASTGKSVQVTTAAQAVEILTFQGQASNGINKLMAQLLAVKLNRKLSPPSPETFVYEGQTLNITTLIAEADGMLEDWSSGDWNSLSKSQKNAINALMTKLDYYNNNGPHCS